LRIENWAAEPAVVRLRTEQDETAVSVFVAPGSIVTVDGLPEGAYRPEFAVGELWSRACNEFAAGMRSQRFGGFSGLNDLQPLLIPPVTIQPIDIPAPVFARD